VNDLLLSGLVRADHLGGRLIRKPEGGKQVDVRGASRLTLRAVFAGLAGAVFLSWLQNMVWIDFPDGRRMLLTWGSLPAVVTMVIVFLVTVNLALRKLGLRHWSFSQSDIVYALSISAVAVLIGSSSALRQFPPALLSSFHHGRPENEWGRMFTDHLPGWFLPQELRRKVGRYDKALLNVSLAAAVGGGPFPIAVSCLHEGEGLAAGGELVPHVRPEREYMTDVSDPKYERLFGALFTGEGRVPWRLWVRPMLVWGSYAAVLYLTILCFIYLAQKQWIDHERLAFPILAAPLEVTRNGANTRLFADRFFKLGFFLALVYYAHLALAGRIPGFPEIRLFVDLRSFLVNKPWNSILLFLLAFDLVAFALFFMMPKDVTLSFWVFHLVSTFMYPFGSMMGWGRGNPQSSVALQRWPFYGETGFGAFAGVLLLALWTGRRHIARVLRAVFAGSADGFEAGERTAVRLSFWGMSAGVVFLVGFARLAGMRPGLAAFFFGILFVYMLSVVRVRVESAMPAQRGPDIWSGTPDYVYRAAVGSVYSDAHSTVIMGALSWPAMIVASSPMPYMMNAFKLSRSSGARRSAMLAVLAVAVLVGVAVNFVFVLRSYYKSGANALWQTNVALRIPREVADDTRRERPVDVPGLIAVGSAVVVSVALGLLRARFLWWPFHPVGFALGFSFWSSYFWFSAALAWLAKFLVLRYGGAGWHRKTFNLCVGLLAGSAVWGAIWVVFSVLEVKGPVWGAALFDSLF